MNNVEETIKNWYNNENLSVNKIAKRLGVSNVYVVNYLKLAGIQVRARKSMSDEEIVSKGPAKDRIIESLKNNDWKLFSTKNELNIPLRQLEVLMKHYQIPKKYRERKTIETAEEEKNRIESYLQFKLESDTEKEN